jgi:hypothetical protein
MPVAKELHIQTVTYINKTRQGKCPVSILKTRTYYSKIDMVLNVHSGETVMNGANRQSWTFHCGVYISTHFNTITVLGFT